MLFGGLVAPIGFVLSLYPGISLDIRDSRTGLTISGDKTPPLIEVSLYLLIFKVNSPLSVVISTVDPSNTFPAMISRASFVSIFL